MRHPNKVEGYETLEDLAKAVGNMSYDKVSEFLEKLAEDIERQADADYQRGRVKLSSKLYKTSKRLHRSKNSMDEAWKICKPYME